MVERNAGVRPDKRIEFRIGIHLGDVVEESDGDLMGDGVNIAARLEGIANPGAICLSEDAYRQVKGRLDLAVTDLGQTQLKNIAEPIRVYSFEVGQPARAKSAPLTAAQKSAAPRLSIVVMPFANIGGGPKQEPFVDGVTESLTTDLSRIRGAVVIARNTAFAYKGGRVDVTMVGRELNVRYVLEGSVQRGGKRMRVNVQLIDAETGNHLWAERFDKPLADLFDMQDEIVARLAGALNAQLVVAEARRAEQTPNPDSMDLYFQGLAWLNKGLTPDNLSQARSFMEWPAPPSGTVRSPAVQKEERVMDIMVLGVDLGKNVCSVVGLEASGAVVMRRKVRRETLIALTEKLPPCVVGMEACCGAHYLGRVFAAHGHDVRLMSPHYVRPYIKAQKNDDRDAEGIAEAATRPTMRFVELKSQDQLDMQTLHRSRDRLVGERTALINQLRVILLERGFVAPQGKRKLQQFLAVLMDEQGGAGLSREWSFWSPTLARNGPSSIHGSQPSTPSSSAG